MPIAADPIALAIPDGLLDAIAPATAIPPEAEAATHGF